MQKDRIIEIGNIVQTGNWNSPQRGRVYSIYGICPTLNTVGGGGLEPKIIEIVHYECSKSNQNRLLEQLDNERSGA